MNRASSAVFHFRTEVFSGKPCGRVVDCVEDVVAIRRQLPFQHSGAPAGTAVLYSAEQR